MRTAKSHRKHALPALSDRIEFGPTIHFERMSSARRDGRAAMSGEVCWKDHQASLRCCSKDSVSTVSRSVCVDVEGAGVVGPADLDGRVHKIADEDGAIAAFEPQDR
jgi:hypothetical protein